MDLQDISAQYADAVRTVAIIAARPPHPDPVEEADRQRLLRLAMARETSLRGRRDILIGAVTRGVPTQRISAD